jgi:hypothetical protein
VNAKSSGSWATVSALGLGCLVGLLLVSGCGDGAGKLSPVEGQVTVDGAPMAADAEITFVPNGNTSNANVRGKVQADGKYKMTTNGKDGVPAGKYKVVLSAGAGTTADPSQLAKTPTALAASKKPFNKKYENPRTTDVTIDVPGTSYDLKLTR